MQFSGFSSSHKYNTSILDVWRPIRIIWEYFLSNTCNMGILPSRRISFLESHFYLLFVFFITFRLRKWHINSMQFYCKYTDNAIFIPCYASTDKKIVMFVPEVGNGSVSKTTYWYFYNLKFESLTHNEKTYGMLNMLKRFIVKLSYICYCSQDYWIFI